MKVTHPHQNVFLATMGALLLLGTLFTAMDRMRSDTEEQATTNPLVRIRSNNATTAHNKRTGSNPKGTTMGVRSNATTRVKNQPKSKKAKIDPIVVTTSEEKDEDDDDSQHEGVDFLIAGFPKCGTSSLLYTLSEHEEINMPTHEFCKMDEKRRSIKDVASLLQEWFSSSEKKARNNGNKRLKTGLKCPLSIRATRSIERLKFLNPQTQIIVGVRHPILFFQSYYNYRMTDRKKINTLTIPIPNPNELIGGKDKAFLGVYTDLAKYHESLMQLGKVELTESELKTLQRHEDLTLTSTSVRVFLYEIDQLSDTDENRATKFRSDLQNFLDLTNPIPTMSEHNSLAHKKTFPEMIDICDSQFDKLRHLLILHGKASMHWIRDKFIKSPDVVIGGDRKHFLELIHAWGEDPCASEEEDSPS